jgi:glycosyltransferase involved in cell wall biosynthesis
MPTPAVPPHEPRAVAPPARPGTPSVRSDVCVVIPMFNEAGMISEVVGSLREVFPHVVCVDDGSTDGSASIAESAGAIVVRHPVNLGQGAALQTGFEFALRLPHQFSYIVTFDADGQHRIEDAAAMVAEARKGEVDVVLGSRFLSTGQRIPAVRRLVLRGAVAFTRATTGLALTDAHNGLRVFTRDAATLIDLKLSGMAHASEILEVVARHRLRWTEVPIEIVYSDYSRAKGQSSINAVNIVFELVANRVRVLS